MLLIKKIMDIVVFILEKPLYFMLGNNGLKIGKRGKLNDKY